MNDCVKCAKEFGERAAAELGIPGMMSMFCVSLHKYIQYGVITTCNKY